MTSLVRSSVVSRSLPAAPGFILAYYTNDDGLSVPFPWRFNRQTQFIDLEYVDGFTNSTGISDDEKFFRGQQFAGLHLVMGLGDKFIEWCENSIGADVGSVELYERPIVVNANAVAPSENPNSGETGGETTDVISFESAAGSAASKYLKTLIFMKPMVIRYTKSGTMYYRWFSNNFEGNS